MGAADKVKEKFGDERKTQITDSAASIDDEDLIPEEEIVITASRGGYVKRLTSDSFKAQHRGGRGVKGMSTNENDVVDIMVYTKTHTDLLMFTDFGKVYRIRGYEIPEFNKTSNKEGYAKASGKPVLVMAIGIAVSGIAAIVTSEIMISVILIVCVAIVVGIWFINIQRRFS